MQIQIDWNWLRSQFPDLQNLAVLNQGGQKLVFSATHPTDGDVVLKIIHLNQDAESIRREILAVKTINWQRIPQILDEGQITTQLGPSFWIREQRIHGQTVRELLQQGALPIRDVLKLGLQTLETLSKAEEVSIVHRDVKPDNIIRDMNGDFWLLDFGIARHLNLSSLTATALPYGKLTPGYAPPEQSRNVKGEIDARSDLFAVGVTLYEAATGVNPFTQGTSDQMVRLQRAESIPLPPLKLSFAQANEFRDLVDVMTQKRRDLRPSTAKEAFTWMSEICAKEQI